MLSSINLNLHGQILGIITYQIDSKFKSAQSTVCKMHTQIRTTT